MTMCSHSCSEVEWWSSEKRHSFRQRRKRSAGRGARAGRKVRRALGRHCEDVKSCEA